MLCPPSVSVASLRFLSMEKELSQTFHPFTSTKIVGLHLSRPVVHDLYSIMNVKQLSQLFHQCFSILQELATIPSIPELFTSDTSDSLLPFPIPAPLWSQQYSHSRILKSAFFDAIHFLSLVVILMYAEWCVWLPLCLFIFEKKSPCHFFSTPLCVCRKFLPVTKFLHFVSTSYRVSCEIQGFRGIIGAHLIQCSLSPLQLFPHFLHIPLLSSFVKYCSDSLHVFYPSSFFA